MPKQEGNWTVYSKEELHDLWKKEVNAGETRLTEAEWVARYMLEQSRDRAQAKQAPVDNKPVDNQPVGNSVSEAARENPKPVRGKGKGDKQKADPAPPKADDKKKLDSGLTAKQELFCREYITDFNAKRAAEAAGYSKRTAYSIGHENLNKPKIQAFIKALQAPRMEKLDISADRILQEYAAMAFANVGHFLTTDDSGKVVKDHMGLPVFDFSTVTMEQLAGLAGLEIIELPSPDDEGPAPIKVKIKLGDKKGALDVLAKRHGLLKEHVELSGEVAIKPGDVNDLAMRVAFLLRQASAHGKKD